MVSTCFTCSCRAHQPVAGAARFSNTHSRQADFLRSSPLASRPALTKVRYRFAWWPPWMLSSKNSPASGWHRALLKYSFQASSFSEKSPLASRPALTKVRYRIAWWPPWTLSSKNSLTHAWSVSTDSVLRMPYRVTSYLSWFGLVFLFFSQWLLPLHEWCLHVGFAPKSSETLVFLTSWLSVALRPQKL